MASEWSIQGRLYWISAGIVLLSPAQSHWWHTQWWLHSVPHNWEGPMSGRQKWRMWQCSQNWPEHPQELWRIRENVSVAVLSENVKSCTKNTSKQTEIQWQTKLSDTVHTCIPVNHLYTTSLWKYNFMWKSKWNYWGWQRLWSGQVFLHFIFPEGFCAYDMAHCWYWEVFLPVLSIATLLYKTMATRGVQGYHLPLVTEYIYWIGRSNTQIHTLCDTVSQVIWIGLPAT